MKFTLVTEDKLLMRRGFAVLFGMLFPCSSGVIQVLCERGLAQHYVLAGWMVIPALFIMYLAAITSSTGR
jgi:hypothetical protein